jgi:hypothetical protein
MATRSTIGYETPDGGYVGVYCHYDGEPSNIGPSLHAMYHIDVMQMVERALRNGGMRCLHGPDSFELFNEPSHRAHWLHDSWPECSEDYAYRKCLDGRLEFIDGSGAVWEWRPKADGGARAAS